jgi:hypothetical protein
VSFHAGVFEKSIACEHRKSDVAEKAPHGMKSPLHMMLVGSLAGSMHGEIRL